MAPGSSLSTANALQDDKVSLAQDQQTRVSLKPDPITQGSIFDGDWDTSIATPVGKLQVKLSIATSQGKILGKATQDNETVEFINPQLVENRMTWSLQIRKPMRLNLRFEVYVRGDQMAGTAKAGMLPASKLTGERVL
ncbi:hypothetical protein AWM70_07535 [Paenibacillus yonginensis]|uniref:Uncharacterized protein n=1 Tax=Paenibacillus yonginensis TaxID=1462996 RepID=A0A1B1MZ53_9BACL|nr:hypothetical protein AWM70_07535 [Paenibacillus yonginensis]